MTAKSDKDYVRLGKMLNELAESGALNKKQLMWSGFLRGLAQGFGAIIGGTILVALLIWLLGLFNEIPLLGPAADSLTNTVQGDN